MKIKEIKKIEEEIEIRREKLNNFIAEDKNKNLIIQCSEDLDILINKYYSMIINKKIAD